MKVVSRVLQVYFFSPDSPLQHSEDPGHPVGNVYKLYEATLNFFNDQDVRDSQELTGPEVRKTLDAQYLYETMPGLGLGPGCPGYRG